MKSFKYIVFILCLILPVNAFAASPYYADLTFGGADYDGSGAELAININSDGWVYTATKNTLAAFATEPPDIEIGCATMCYAAAETDDVWIDDVKSYTTADGS